MRKPQRLGEVQTASLQVYPYALSAQVWPGPHGAPVSVRLSPPTGTFRAAGCVSFRAGAFDAVGDRNPVPARAGCPQPGGNVPGWAGVSPGAQDVPGWERVPGRATQGRAAASGHDLRPLLAGVEEVAHRLLGGGQ